MEALTCGELVSVCDGGVVLCLVVLVALFVVVGPHLLLAG